MPNENSDKNLLLRVGEFIYDKQFDKWVTADSLSQMTLCYKKAGRLLGMCKGKTYDLLAYKVLPVEYGGLYNWPAAGKKALCVLGTTDTRQDVLNWPSIIYRDRGDRSIYSCSVVRVNAGVAEVAAELLEKYRMFWLVAVEVEKALTKHK